MTEPVVITEETTLPAEPPEYENSEKVISQLKEDPKFVVMLHERQLERMAMIIEEMAQRILDLEKKFTELEESVSFPRADSPIPNFLKKSKS